MVVRLFGKKSYRRVCCRAAVGWAQAGVSCRSRVPKRGRARCLYRGHGTLPAVGLGTASHCAARCRWGRVMGSKPRKHDLEPERMSSGEGFILTDSYSWQKWTKAEFYPS